MIRQVSSRSSPNGPMAFSMTFLPQNALLALPLHKGYAGPSGKERVVPGAEPMVKVLPLGAR